MPHIRKTESHGPDIEPAFVPGEIPEGWIEVLTDQKKREEDRWELRPIWAGTNNDRPGVWLRSTCTGVLVSERGVTIRHKSRFINADKQRYTPPATTPGLHPSEQVNCRCATAPVPQSRLPQETGGAYVPLEFADELIETLKNKQTNQSKPVMVLLDRILDGKGGSARWCEVHSYETTVTNSFDSPRKQETCVVFKQSATELAPDVQRKRAYRRQLEPGISYYDDMSGDEFEINGSWELRKAKLRIAAQKAWPVT